MLSFLIKLLGGYRLYERVLRGQISKGSFPEHVGIILDGNRRWASAKLLPRSLGHAYGADKAEELLEWCHELGIKTLTVYALSTENLTRDGEEVRELVELIEERLERLLANQRIHSYKVRVKALGKLELLPQRIRELLAKLEEVTREYDGHYLNLAVAYGGRQEIMDGVRKMAEKVSRGELKPYEIDNETLEKHLYTSHLRKSEPDLIIRTSGEERLSDFLLWQSAYSELLFLDAYWPDFRKIDLMRAVRIYQKRARRFGR